MRFRSRSPFPRPFLFQTCPSCPNKINSDWIRFYRDLIENHSIRTILATLARLRAISLHRTDFVQKLPTELLRMMTRSLSLSNRHIDQLTSMNNISSSDEDNLRKLGNIVPKIICKRSEGHNVILLRKISYSKFTYLSIENS